MRSLFLAILWYGYLKGAFCKSGAYFTTRAVKIIDLTNMSSYCYRNLTYQD